MRAISDPRGRLRVACRKRSPRVARSRLGAAGMDRIVGMSKKKTMIVATLALATALPTLQGCAAPMNAPPIGQSGTQRPVADSGHGNGGNGSNGGMGGNGGSGGY